MTDQKSQSIDLRKEGMMEFHRGSALSIFASDRREDFMALACSLLIALGVALLIG